MYFKVYNSVFLVHSQCCASITISEFCTFHHPKKKTSYPLTVTLHSFSQPPSNHSSLSVSKDMPIVDSPLPWNHTICGLSRLVSFRLTLAGSIHAIACISDSFFLNGWKYSTFPLSIYQLMDRLFPTSWLLWIRLLWTFMYKFLFGHMCSVLLKWRLWDHAVALFNLWGIARLFPKVTVPLTFPLAECKGPGSSHLLTSTC